MLDQEKTLLLHEIELSLDEVRPHLAVDGGDVAIVELTDEMTLKVRWMGACQTCSMSAMTMRAGVEQIVKSRSPQVLSVIAINSFQS